MPYPDIDQQLLERLRLRFGMDQPPNPQPWAFDSASAMPMSQEDYPGPPEPLAREEGPSWPKPVDQPVDPLEARRTRIQKLEALKQMTDAIGGVGPGLVNAAIAGTWSKHGNVQAKAPAGPDTSGLERNIGREENALQVEEERRRNLVPKPLIEKLRAKGLDLPDEVTFQEMGMAAAPQMAMAGMKSREDIAGKELAAQTARATSSAQAVAGRATDRNAEMAKRQLISQQNTERRGIESDKTINQYKAKIRTARTVEKLLTEAGDNPAAVRVAMAQTQKVLASEVGTMTERDIQAYEGAYGIPGIIMRAERFGTGNFTNQQKERVKQVAQMMAADAGVALKELGDARIGSFYETNKEQLGIAGKTKADIEQMYRQLLDAPGGSPGAAAANAAVTLIDPEGNEYPVRADAVEAAKAKAKAQGVTLQVKNATP